MSVSADRKDGVIKKIVAKMECFMTITTPCNSLEKTGPSSLLTLSYKGLWSGQPDSN